MKSSQVRFGPVFAALSLATMLAGASDPVLGTWKLNLARSRFLAGPAFKSETRTYEQQKDGTKVTIHSVDGKGREATIIYVATPDGQAHPVSGSGGPADSVALTSVDEFTAISILTHAGREIARTTRTVSKDGKTMTISYKGQDPDGYEVNYTLFFDRVN